MRITKEKDEESRDRVACEQAPGLEERSKFIGRRKAPATRCKAPRKGIMPPPSE